MAELAANIAAMFFVSKGIEATVKGTVSAFKGDKKKDAAEQETGKAKQEAASATAAEQEEGAKKSGARRALLGLPTSGFGANKNLARSFLTTL